MTALSNIAADPSDRPARVAPRYALTPEEAAASLGVGLSTLADLVKEGAVPKPFSVPGHKKLVRFDPDDIRQAVKDWKESANPASDGGWNGVR